MKEQAIDLFDESGDGLPEGAAVVDYKVEPTEILEEIDKQLKAFGLEILLFDTGDDSYAWKIVRREIATKRSKK